MTASGPKPSAWAQFSRWLKEEVIVAPLLPVLHPSPLRMKGLGLFTLFGHPLFWFVWAVWIPQPYENLPLRLFTASLGFLLLSERISGDPTSRLSGQVFTAVFWFELPFLFSWMYLCNGGNHAWLASMAAMILSYYFSTDWRIASVGLAAGGLAARILFELWGPVVPPMSTELLLTNTMVIAFCVSMGTLLGVSSANLRREHLAHTLTTMGIMAHELRTPLATMALVGDAVRHAAAEQDAATQQAMDQLGTRLSTLVRNMNHQIDTQIANARLMRLPGHKEAVSAGELVRESVANYPYRSTRERDCVCVQVDTDFVFEGSRALFAQVIDNLLKNALRSLAAASTASQPGDLTIEVTGQGERGRIVLADRGVGIDPASQPRIFEPFFSTNRGTGHGLGLAFCHQVVHSARGTIRVKSERGQGAAFTIELPVLN
ncbi:MAG TPA: HAMP domain-containing sensor histidine kinase [Ramlibacter sp.]|nr:HAMP domain-containing sensor histidine kinase [Ramlibacter sp.]